MAKLNERKLLKKKIKEELKDVDGWGEIVEDTLWDLFEDLEKFMYEIRHAVRGSYAKFGTSIDDLTAKLDEYSTRFEEAASDIEMQKQEINEKLVEPSKEDLAPIEAKFAELGLEVEKKGKTFMDNVHYQLRKELDHDVTRNDVSEIFAELCNLDSRDMPTVCSVGVHRDGNNIISASLDVLKKYVPEGDVEESCKKEDNKLQEDADMATEDRLKIFADYFDVDIEDCDYDEERHIVESPVGDYYFGTEEEMKECALEFESELIDDMGVDLYTPYFRDQILGDPDLFDASWFRDFWNEYNDSADEADQIEVDSDEYAVQLYVDTFGEDALEKVINSEKLLNKEAITDEVIRQDGIAGILASYDGNEEDMGHGLYAYRFN